MLAEQFISYDIEALGPKDSVSQALKRMNELRINLLPVVHEDKLMNYASLEFLEKMEPGALVSTLPVFASVLPFVFVNRHILNALNQLNSLELSLMAVLDENNSYLGVLRTRDLVSGLSKSLTIKGAGSLIVLKTKPMDYSLSDISRIVEYSDAKILGMLIFENANSDELEIHIKLNTTNLKHILATLERYDYHVVQYFNREDLADDTDHRYENLMKFIDV